MRSLVPAILSLFILSIGVNSCKISYSFSGTNISPEVKTFSVEDFPNRAQLYIPNLSETFVDKLKEKILSQTNLIQVTNKQGDINFSGAITDYTIRPNAVSGNETAATNRLTITINVKYTNNKDHKQDWEKSFSNYADYNANQDISQVEEELINEVLDKIIQDIYNNSIASW